MSNPLRVLIVEDSEDDALLVLRLLSRSGYEPVSERVESEAAMRKALAEKPWDVILSDFVIPGFGGLEALKIAKEIAFDVPFIMVSNKVSEDTLVEAVRAGAGDFITKDHLERLGPVMKRNLADAPSRAGMRRAEIEWRAAFDAVQDAIFIHDAEFRIVRANLPYAALARMPIQDVIGKPYWEVFPKAEGPLPGCGDVCAGRVGPAEEEVRLPTGEVFASRSFPIADAAGRSRHYLHVMQNTTERDRVRETLENSERRFRGLIKHASDLMAVVDAHGTIAYISPSITQMGGYDADDVLGRNYVEFTHPEDRAGAIAGFSELIRDPGVVHKTEFRFRRKDGAWTTLESVATNALADPLINGIVINARDVTERTLAEEVREKTLERARKQLEAVGWASMSEGLIAGDVERFAREVAELAAGVTGVERASVWLFNDDETELRCIDLYEATPAKHSAGLVLAERYFKDEFQSLKSARCVASDDPMTDPRAAGYVEGYLKPLRITSMLHSMIHLTGKNLGLLGFEHVDKPHHWESDEIAFAAQLAGQIALAIVNQSRLRSQAALKKVNRALKVLSVGNMEVVRATSETALLEAVCRAAVEVGGYLIAWVGYPAQDAGKTVLPQAAAGIGFEVLRTQHMTWDDREGGRGPSGRALRSGQVQVVQDISRDAGIDPWREIALANGIASSISLPLHFNGQAFGVLTIHAAELNAFDDEEVKLLTEMAGGIAFGVRGLGVRGQRDRAMDESRRSLERLGSVLEGTIQAVALTVEKRDPYTAGHQRRVAELAVAIGQDLALPGERIEGLRLGATIHDIGKIYVPAEILSRPGRLSPTEMEIIKTHPSVGFEIVEGIDFPWPIAQMILQHHERLDGSGYPQGLKGEHIILESRILGVADVVEAMSSHRPYRAGLGLDAALAQVKQEAGTKLDTEVVAACERLFREKGFRLPVLQSHA